MIHFPWPFYNINTTALFNIIHFDTHHNSESICIPNNTSVPASHINKPPANDQGQETGKTKFTTTIICLINYTCVFPAVFQNVLCEIALHRKTAWLKKLRITFKSSHMSSRKANFNWFVIRNHTRSPQVTSKSP